MKLRGVICLLASALLTQQVIAKAANESAYTDLKLEDCRVIDKSAEHESVTWWCVGFEGIPVWVAEGDLRMFVSFGEGAQDELAASQTLGSFNRIHHKLEWRLATSADGRKTPVATILRYFLHNEGKREHQILVVTQLKPGETCHIAYLDALANPNANQDARDAADRLAGVFDCGEHEPELVGPQTAGVFME